MLRQRCSFATEERKQSGMGLDEMAIRVVRLAVMPDTVDCL